MMHKFRKRNLLSFLIALGLGAELFGTSSLTARAETIDYKAEAEANKLLPVDTNEIDGWPQGPAVSAKAAILMDADSGAILYSKNIHEHLYPASTTKILTAYIARQHSEMNEVVEYSADAINSIVWWNDSNIGIKAGESITMEQSLYSLLVASANECANAIAEHVSGSVEDFVELMNQTAAELGCTDSHFVTTNGKHDDGHYTSAYDMALIARQFFADDLLSKMSDTPSYILPESSTLSQQLYAKSKNQLFPGREYPYEYLVGSKTGYTDIARQSLVSCAEKDGLKLICVVMRDESPMQYTDTIDLFNYGFSNFKSVNVADNDTTYSISQNGLFMTGSDVFDDIEPILSIDPNASLVLPADMSLEDLSSELSYDDLEKGQAALIHYSYKDQPLGSAAILFSSHPASFDFHAAPEALLETAASDDNAESESADVSAVLSSTPQNRTNAPGKDSGILFLDVKKIALIAGIILLLIAIGFIVYKILHSRRLSRRRQSILRRHGLNVSTGKGKRKKPIIDFDRYTNH